MKKLQLELTDKQYESYQEASRMIRGLGIPNQPQSLVQMMIASRNVEEIVEAYLSQMKKLANEGKRQIREGKAKGAEK